MHNKNESYEFKIDNRIPQKQLDALSPTIRQELFDVIEKLKVDPFDCHQLRVKQMQPPLQRIYEVYLGHKGIRLTFTVQLQTRTVVLKFVGGRIHAINRDW